MTHAGWPSWPILLGIAVLVILAAVAGWWAGSRRSRRVDAVGTPSFVAGKPAEWADFARRHQRFLELFPNLKAAINAAFTRKWQSDRPVDPVIFYTGMVCAEEFLEVLLLSANGYGFAGLRLLRGMYERVVTMRHLSAHPDQAEAFLDYHYVQNGKLAKAVLGTLGDDLTAAQRAALKEAVQEYDRVKDAFVITGCDKCGATRVNHTWNKLNLVDMAQSDKSTRRLLVPCYYEPLGQAHATAQAFLSRMKVSAEEGGAFDATPQRKEADRALLRAHNLLLNVLDVQRSHFGLKTLDGPLDECAAAFLEIWASPPS